MEYLPKRGLFGGHTDVFKGKKRDIGSVVAKAGFVTKLWNDEFVSCSEDRSLRND
jgi:hypothetical protein